jgi:ATP-dependent Clp protease ATP-binding subunit ClpA
MIDLDDLLAALIVEDQNKIPDALEMLGRTGPVIFGLTTHQPFLPPDAATSLLESIQRSLPRSQSIPTSADMAISPALGQTLAAASDLREKLQSKEVTPLHLLAVLLAGSHKRVQALRDAGITEEKILDVIRRENQL